MSMHETPKQFWMTFSRKYDATLSIFESLVGAESQARRLAEECPGETFYVLEAVSAVRKREFETITFRNTETSEPRPF